ncbi:MAG: metallophosphoesterase [Clostridia bacterium]|nr:metallophosphoesterase [Clostridia bacterium]
MAVYCIADLHLSLGTGAKKSMEVFGKRWENYEERLKKNWTSLVSPDDTVIIPGDISWATVLEESAADLHFIDSLPGRKILGKGNHDFWWSTMKKHREFFEKEKITTIDFLFNNAIELDDFIVAGSRGWFSDEDNVTLPNDPDFEKINARELSRMKLSLDCAAAIKRNSPEKEIVVFTHFPVVWGDEENKPFTELIRAYGVKRVYFGHIHGAAAVEDPIRIGDLECRLIAADAIGFLPKYVPKL